MKKAMMGSMTDSVIKSASCACLVVKPQVRHVRMYCQQQPSHTGQCSSAPHAVQLQVGILSWYLRVAALGVRMPGLR
jgi:hypothetical protein